MVGMPGTGMGGLLYLCMAVWMPVHELCRLARGRSSARRWAFIARSWLVVGGSLALLWAAMLSVKAVLSMTATRASSGEPGEGLLVTAQGSETTGMLASAAWASAIALASVVVLVHVLRLTIGARYRGPPSGRAMRSSAALMRGWSGKRRFRSSSAAWAESAEPAAR